MKEEMSYFDLLSEVNIIREIGLYLDIPSIEKFQSSYSEKRLLWLNEIFWRHYWYSHLDPRGYVKALPYQTMPIMALDIADSSTLSPNPNLCIDNGLIAQNEFMTYFESWKDLVLQAIKAQNILKTSNQRKSDFWNALLFEVSRGYYSKYRTEIDGKWIQTDLIQAHDSDDDDSDSDSDDDDYVSSLCHKMAMSQLGNIVQALAFSECRKSLDLSAQRFPTGLNSEHEDEMYSILEEYSECEEFQEFALLGAIRGRNMKLIHDLTLSKTIDIQSLHLVAVLPLFGKQFSDITDDLLLLQFLESKMSSEFTRFSHSDIASKYAIRTGKIDYVKHFFGQEKSKKFYPHDDKIFSAIRSRNVEIFEFVASNVDPQGRDFRYLSYALSGLVQSQGEERVNAEKIFLKIIQDFPCPQLIAYFHKEWISLKIGDIPVYHLLIDSGLSICLSHLLLSLSYEGTGNVKLLQECLNLAKYSPYEKESLSQTCSEILIHVCAGPFYRNIGLIHACIATYTTYDIHKEVPSIELVQTLANEITTSDEDDFSPYTIALIASISRFNLDLFEELREYAGLTYDEVAQELIRATLTKTFEDYLQLLYMAKITFDLDSALFLAIAKQRREIAVRLSSHGITRYKDAFIVACQYDNVYYAEYLIYHELVIVDEIVSWVEESGNFEILNLVHMMIEKIR